MRAREWIISATLIAAATAACGTTVPQAGRSSGSALGAAPNGLTAPTDALNAAPIDHTGPVGTVSGTGSTSLEGGTSQAAGTGQPQQAPAGPGTAPAGTTPVIDALQGRPGITPTSVLLGFETAGNAPATRAAFGLPASTAPPLDDVLKVLFKYVNDRGGFGGRKGEYLIVETDVAEGDFESQAQAACTSFTEDHKVFAAVSAVSRTPTMFSCLANHRTVGIAEYPGLAIPLSMWDGMADYLYGPIYLTHPRSGFLVDSWIRMGLLTKTSRIGLISIDEPTRQAYAQMIRSGLKRRGLNLVDEVKASNAKSLGDLGPGGQEMSNAVLQFRAENVDVVLFANTAGGGPALFMPAAENQGYQPRYGLSSYEFLRTLIALAPEPALERSVAAGWLHAYDLTQKKSLPKNPERDKCVKIFRDAGIQVDDKTEITISAVCEVVFLLRDALAGVSVGGAPSFRSAVERLGRFPTGQTDPLLFGPRRRHDAISTYRETRYSTQCGCFNYTTGPIAIP